jgi:hypothetical protein
MNDQNKQAAQHNYRLVVLLTDDQKRALDRLVEREQEASLINVTQSDIVRQLIARAVRHDHCMAEPS